MIDSKILSKSFLKFAKSKVVLRKAIRSKSELKARPSILYQDIELNNCIIRRKKNNYNYSETGVTSSETLNLIRLKDETQFSIGDKILFENTEYRIESPPYLRDRIKGFETVVIEMSYVGIKS